MTWHDQYSNALFSQILISPCFFLDYLQAVGLLCAMSWDVDGSSCYACLTAIVTHLLKLPLNADREGRLVRRKFTRTNFMEIYNTLNMFLGMVTNCHKLVILADLQLYVSLNNNRKGSSQSVF